MLNSDPILESSLGEGPPQMPVQLFKATAQHGRQNIGASRATDRNERANGPHQYFMDVCSVSTVASGIAVPLAVLTLAMPPPGLTIR